MEVLGKEVRTSGKLIRIGYLDGEGYQFLEDPEAALAILKKSRSRIDLFTFIQKVSDTVPHFGYQME